MRFRHPARTLLASTLWTLPGTIALTHTAHAKNLPSSAKPRDKRVILAQNPTTPPKTALITAVRGSTLTLAVGADEGAKIGQTFRVAHGNTSAKLQITAVTGVESTASLIAADPGFIVTVGENASYVGEEALAPALPDTATPATPGAPQPLPTLPPAPGTATATAPPQQAILTGVAGKTATLSIGAQDGAVVGAIYALPLDGDIKARMQITRVNANSSQTTLEILDEGFQPTVGDTTRFVRVEAVTMPTPPVVPPVIPVLPSLPVRPASPTDVPSPVTNNNTQVMPAPVAALSGSTATVTGIQGQTVTISAGSAQGAKTALNLPILRSGAIVGLLRLQVVSTNSSTGVVLWRDESLTPITPGDAVGILGAPPEVGAPVFQGPPVGKVAATPVRYETGASNAAVPKAEATYELLAALASGGLIKSQKASVFQDDGARRHRTAEDIIFTRAQVAGFIREAITNYEDSGSARDRAALGILTKDFRRDLLKQGETDATLAPFQEGGVAIGVSGLTRYTVLGGTNDAARTDPFSEQYGAQRSKTGFDSRTNLFAKISPRLSFYSSFDYGSDVNRNDGGNNLQVRKAYLSYDASNILRGLTLNLGRKEFWWGPGQFGTSLLGDAAGGLNSFSSSFERGSYRLEALYAYLGQGPEGKRSFYGQTASIKVNNIFRFGTTATVLAPGDTFNPKYFLTAFSPLSLYLVKDDEKNGGSNDNNVLGGFVEATVAKGARAYGEIFIDDMSLKSQPEQQNRTGSVVGLQLSNPKNPAKAGFKVEFARFNSYSYLALPTSPDNNFGYYYQFRNAPLGYPVTPMAPTIAGGAESLRFEGYFMPTKRLRLFAGIEFADVNSDDQNPNIQSLQGFSRQQTRRLAAAYDISRSFTLTVRGVDNRTDQPNFFRNEASQRDRYVSLEIGRSF